MEISEFISARGNLVIKSEEIKKKVFDNFTPTYLSFLDKDSLKSCRTRKIEDNLSSCKHKVQVCEYAK